MPPELVKPQAAAAAPTTTLTMADGESYKLTLNANAFANLEELLGINFLEGTFRPDSAINIRAFIWACMEEEYPDLSLEDVGALLHWGQLPKIMEAVSQLMGAGMTASDPNSLAPYVPTPKPVLARALELSGLSGMESFCDLGCGDGRSLEIAAGLTRGTVVGFETNNERVELSRSVAALLNQERRDCGQVLVRDVDIRKYEGGHNVVFVYLLTSSNRLLQETLSKGVPPGGRVVTHAFPMPGWKPTKEEVFYHEDRPYGLFVYEIGKHL